MCVTAGIMAGVGAAGSIGGALINSSAAGNAAQAQVGGANYAANLQAQEAANALGFQEQQFNTTQQNLAPYLQSGKNALGALDTGLGLPALASPAAPGTGTGGAPSGAPPSAIGGTPNPAGSGNIAPGIPRTALNSMGPQGGATGIRTAGPTAAPGYGGVNSLTGQGAPIPGTGAIPATDQAPSSSAGAPGSLDAPWTQQFQAPTGAQAAQYPGYQFQLQQGEQALQRSAAAQGNLLTGNTARDVNAYGQGVAQNDYNNVYNQALGQYQQNYNIFENNQANQYNRLAAMAGVGQTAVNQLGTAGQNAASNVSNIDLTAGAQQGQQANNAAAATASGYIGGANALSGGLSGVAGSLSNSILLSQLLNQQPQLPGAYYSAG